MAGRFTLVSTSGQMLETRLKSWHLVPLSYPRKQASRRRGVHSKSLSNKEL